MFNPYEAPASVDSTSGRLSVGAESSTQTPEKRPLLTAERVFFAASAATSMLFAVRHSIGTVMHARRGLPNDHLAAILEGSLAVGLILVALAAVLLATGFATFRPSSPNPLPSARVARFTAFLVVVVLASLGCLFALGGARQGIFLIAGCATWVVAFFYERNRHDQAIFRGVRWFIRAIAISIGLAALTCGIPVLFDAAILYNKLHLHWPILNFPRMPANVPESDEMVYGQLFAGVPFAILGLLLVYEVFRGFRFALNPLPSMQSAESYK